MELSELIRICQFSGFALCIIALTMVFNFIRSIFKEPSNEIYSRLNMLEQWYHELNQDLNIAKVEGDKSLDGICNSINATDQSVTNLNTRIDKFKEVYNGNTTKYLNHYNELFKQVQYLSAIVTDMRVYTASASNIKNQCKKKSVVKRSRS